MEDYLREARIAKLLLEREDPGISAVSFARKLLRRSGLVALEQRGALAEGGASWNLEKMEDALKLMYGYTHRDDKQRVGGNRSRSSPSLEVGRIGRKTRLSRLSPKVPLARRTGKRKVVPQMHGRHRW